MNTAEISITDLAELILRFLSRPKFYHGAITLKFFNGNIKNIVADDSFDMKYLAEKKIKTGLHENKKENIKK